MSSYLLSFALQMALPETQQKVHELTQEAHTRADIPEKHLSPRFSQLVIIGLTFFIPQTLSLSLSLSLSLPLPSPDRKT